MNGLRLFIRRWGFIGAALFALGGWAARLQGAVDDKADKDAVLEMARDIVDIKNKLNDMDQRQREYYCADKPAWCR